MLNKAVAVLALIGAFVFLFGVISAISLISSVTGTSVSTYMVDPTGQTRRADPAETPPLVTADPHQHGAELALVSLSIGLGAMLWGVIRFLARFKRSTERALRGLEAIGIMLSLGVTAMLAATFPDSSIAIYLIPLAAAMVIFALPLIRFLMGRTNEENNLTQKRK